MTTSPDLACERKSFCSACAADKTQGFFAILGLFAALSLGASAEAQGTTPTPRAPKLAPPPVTAPATPVQTPGAPPSTVTPAPTSPSTPAMPPSTTTTPKGWEPAFPENPSTTRTDGPTLAPGPIVDQPPQSSTVPGPVVVADPEGQLEAKRTEEKLEIKEKLSTIDTQLEHLDKQREERGRVTGPVSMLAAGYTTGLAALAVSLGAFYGAERVADAEGYKKRLDINDDNQLDADDENSFRTIARTMGALSAVGFGIGIAGSIFLAKRLKERRVLDPEVRHLQNERRELRRELNYTLGPVKNGVALGLSGRF